MQPGSMVIGPKKANDMGYAHDDDFWYGEKKDKRFGTCTLLDLPPVPSHVKNEVYQSADSLKNTGAFRKPTVNSQLMDPSTLRLIRQPKDYQAHQKELIVIIN